MKKFLKMIAYAYACYAVVCLVGAAATYIYGCLKYGTKMMNEGVRFALSCYKMTIVSMLRSATYKLRKSPSPYYELLKDAKDWNAPFEEDGLTKKV